MQKAYHLSTPHLARSRTPLDLIFIHKCKGQCCYLRYLIYILTAKIAIAVEFVYIVII